MNVSIPHDFHMIFCYHNKNNKKIKKEIDLYNKSKKTMNSRCMASVTDGSSF